MFFERLNMKGEPGEIDLLRGPDVRFDGSIAQTHAFHIGGTRQGRSAAEGDDLCIGVQNPMIGVERHGLGVFDLNWLTCLSVPHHISSQAENGK